MSSGGPETRGGRKAHSCGTRSRKIIIRSQGCPHLPEHTIVEMQDGQPRVLAEHNRIHPVSQISSGGTSQDYPLEHKG